MARSFEKGCDGCGALIRITASSDGWLIYDVDTGSLHHCGSNLDITAKVGEPLTVKTHCWFCDDVVFFHRSEHGGMVLFDSLGSPWPVHPCWKKNTRYHSSYVAKLHQTLKSHNLSKKGEYDFISAGIRIKKPEITIHMQSNDHRALDAAVETVVRMLVRSGFSHLRVIPLKRQQAGPGDANKVFLHKRLISIEQGLSSSALNKWQLALSNLQNINLPKGVEISITSS